MDNKAKTHRIRNFFVGIGVIALAIALAPLTIAFLVWLAWVRSRTNFEKFRAG